MRFSTLSTLRWTRVSPTNSTSGRVSWYQGQKEGMRAFLEKRALSETPRADWDVVSAGFPWAVSSPDPPSGKRKKVGASGRD